MKRYLYLRTRRSRLLHTSHPTKGLCPHLVAFRDEPLHRGTFGDRLAGFPAKAVGYHGSSRRRVLDRDRRCSFGEPECPVFICRTIWRSLAFFRCVNSSNRNWWRSVRGLDCGGCPHEPAHASFFLFFLFVCFCYSR